MEKSFEEFKGEVQKRTGKRNNNVKNSVGVRQGFLFLQKRKWRDVGQPISEKQFQQIVRKVGQGLSKVLLEKHYLILPQNMGTIDIRFTDNKAYYDENGKLCLPTIVNWDATLKLWYEDPEAYTNRLLIRDKFHTKIITVYDRSKATYNNKNYYNFIINRPIYRTMLLQMREGTLKTFLL